MITEKTRTTPSAGVKKRVSILGVTGTIGQQTCEIISENPEAYDVVALTGHRNVDKLAEAAINLKAKFVAIADPELESELRARFENTKIICASGPQSLIEAAQHPADWIMASIVGAAGLAPTLTALRQGTTVALANKECLVSAGALFMSEAAKYKTTVLPVDSEHSAVFQSLDNLDCKSVDRIVLTASGGPFRTWSHDQIKSARPQDALKHPNWTMGQKITIDSATLMNKGLEIIEAYHLFNVEPFQLSAIVHPQSILHCLVYYSDGSVIAQASLPDMRTPIAYSLGWPDRLNMNFPRLDLAAIGQLTFEQPDDVRFPALRLARQAMEQGGIAPTILNAANEIAVEAFLNKRISFGGITDVIEKTLESGVQNLAGCTIDNLEGVLDIDMQTRAITAQIIGDGKASYKTSKLSA